MQHTYIKQIYIEHSYIKHIYTSHGYIIEIYIKTSTLNTSILYIKQMQTCLYQTHLDWSPQIQDTLNMLKVT